MSPRTVWVGPVANYQVHAPASDLFVSFPATPTGLTPTGMTPYEDLANNTSLSAFLTSKNISADQPVILHGFSAGGDAIKKFLQDPAARDRAIAVVLHDATYQKHGGDEGFIAYGTEAAQNLPGRIFVATASGGGSSRGISDSDSMEALRQAIEARTGQSFQAITAPWAPKPPVKAWQLGRTVLFDFGTTYAHVEHATVLAPLVNNNVVTPMLGGTSAPAPAPAAPTASGAAPVTPASPAARPALAPAPPAASSPMTWTFPPSIPALSGRPLLPAVLVAAGAGLFIYALVRTFK